MLLDELVVQMNISGDTKPLERAMLLLERAQAAYKRIIDNPALDFDGSPAIKSLQSVQRQMDKLDEKINQKRVIRIEQEEQKQNLQGLKDAQEYLAQAKKQHELEERYSIKLRNGQKMRINLDEAIQRRIQGTTDKMAALRQGLMELQYNIPVLGRLTSMMGMFGAMAGVGFSLQKYIAVSDQWKTIEGQIKNVSKSIQEAEAAQKELYNIASRTRQSYSATAELYTSVSRNASELGKGSTEILKFTEDVSNAMLLGGSSAQAQQAALVQLGQALGSGVLRGDELNSILEQAPRLAKAIAAGMDTSVGNLRAMGAKGEITSQKLFEAIRKQSEKLKSELGNTPWTVEQATTKVQNAMGMLFYTIERKLGIGSKIAAMIARVSTMLEYINNVLADMPAERLISMMKALVLYAGVFYVYTKRTAIVETFSAGASAVRMLTREFRSATGALAGMKAVIRAIGAEATVASVVATGGLVLIIALVVFLILMIEDLYYWITGGKSVIGENFGTWGDFVAEFSRRWEQWKTEFGKSIDWICEKLGGFLTGIVELIAQSEIFQTVWSGIKSVFEGFLHLVEGVFNILNGICQLLGGPDLQKKLGMLSDVKGNGVNIKNAIQDAAAISNKMQNNNQTYNAVFNISGDSKALPALQNWYSGIASTNFDMDGGILHEGG